MAALAGEPLDRLVLLPETGVARPEDVGDEVHGLLRRHLPQFQRPDVGVFEQGRQPPAARHDHQPGGHRRQQRPDLLGPGGVVEDQQHPAVAEQGPALRRQLRLRARDLVAGHARRAQHLPHRLRRGDGAAGRAAQVGEQDAVGEAVDDPVRPVQRQRGLADARHSLDHDGARPHGLADQQIELAEADHAPGEVGVVGGEAYGGRPGRRSQAHRFARGDPGALPQRVLGRALGLGGRPVVAPGARGAAEPFDVEDRQRAGPLVQDALGPPRPEPAHQRLAGDPRPVRQLRLAEPQGDPRALPGGGLAEPVRQLQQVVGEPLGMVGGPHRVPAAAVGDALGDGVHHRLGDLRARRQQAAELAAVHAQCRDVVQRGDRGALRMPPRTEDPDHVARAEQVDDRLVAVAGVHELLGHRVARGPRRRLEHDVDGRRDRPLVAQHAAGRDVGAAAHGAQRLPVGGGQPLPEAARPDARVVADHPVTSRRRRRRPSNLIFQFSWCGEKGESPSGSARFGCVW